MNEPTLNRKVSAHADPAPTPQLGSIQTLPIEFTGTGSEYFRIWIVNLFLILVTLSLYTPWARARKLRYFHGNTLVDGHPLAFHGDPKKMFRGYLLVGVMALVASSAGQFSLMAGLTAFLILALVWPALLKSSLQFRLANTSWRGLRFHFTGSVRGAYQIFLPLLLPGAVFLGVAVLMDPEQRAAPPTWYLWTMPSVLLLMWLLVPMWLLWRLKKYQHDHYVYAGLETQFKVSLDSFFGVFLKTLGVILASILLAGVFMGAIIAGVWAVMEPAAGSSGGGVDHFVHFVLVLQLLWVIVPLLALAVLGVYCVAIPYFTARMQNLVWSKTGGRDFRFQSELSFRSALKLTIKNWLLIGLSLGLYWPFAAVAMTRLKLQAMAVLTRVDLQALMGRAKTHEGDAAGDAAGDLLGVDIGL